MFEIRLNHSPMGDNVGNIISHDFLMAKEVNMQCSSVFIRVDKSTLPVPEIAAARERPGKDICQIRNVKSATGEVLMKDDESKERWDQYFNMLMHKENERVETEERDPNQAMTRNISEEETETVLKGMKCGKAVVADELPAEAWKCIGNFGIKILCKLFNSIMNTKQLLSSWRQSILIPIFKGKCDIQECKNDRGIKLLSHNFKMGELWIGG